VVEHDVLLEHVPTRVSRPAQLAERVNVVTAWLVDGAMSAIPTSAQSTSTKSPASAWRLPTTMVTAMTASYPGPRKTARGVAVAALIAFLVWLSRR